MISRRQLSDLTGTVSRYLASARFMNSVFGVSDESHNGERALSFRVAFPPSSFYLHEPQRVEQLFRTIRQLTFTRLSSSSATDLRRDSSADNAHERARSSLARPRAYTLRIGYTRRNADRARLPFVTFVISWGQMKAARHFPDVTLVSRNYYAD